MKNELAQLLAVLNKGVMTEDLKEAVVGGRISEEAAARLAQADHRGGSSSVDALKSNAAVPSTTEA
ncbi:MAG: hypothetical protein UX80_C0005G0056 [Candidatus Amesbacteria bacterium GW2011_GWA2_47_11b]|uniref:Uncharacterized protein n=3 Tax=Candidatus Amesiibacteriota TaxID=1752730 RepID=A0A0G1UW81_9BACT|nr:MAG: hypothetical protein UX42_C0001G0114 [Microgenomates group bacterium GW2011_GWC1_46_20]KKU58236.1 MAG: hypothetical protein UX80_C0005G0056 [Candidatus Amesbacteria bacterium GW2011_GWA2_47_11b]KKU70288.1 MAG: hypothetical protein UX92_C0002G0032 [Candidatus Amesbacteria bacterium GW2011_GWA1_47_20]KKU82879.1 MAG: hypothetical protein UY11_C0036G0005 [Candidatus Amesbacteria bacterium GW2011_GWC2_47_8]